jgi:hypothetical protein
MKCNYCPGLLIKLKEFYKFYFGKYGEEYICVLCQREDFKRLEK